MKILRVIVVVFAFLSAMSEVPGSRAQVSASSPKEGSAPQMVIIDTDIGDDIDDAFALALALKSPELKILGVTTTFGNTEMRARLLDRYCRQWPATIFPCSRDPRARQTTR